MVLLKETEEEEEEEATAGVRAAKEISVDVLVLSELNGNFHTKRRRKNGAEKLFSVEKMLLLFSKVVLARSGVTRRTNRNPRAVQLVQLAVKKNVTGAICPINFQHFFMALPFPKTFIFALSEMDM